MTSSAQPTSVSKESGHEWAEYRDTQLEVTREKLLELRCELKFAINSLKIFNEWEAAMS